MTNKPNTQRARINVKQAIQLRNKGASLQEIAQLQGVSKQAVHAVLRDVQGMIAPPEQIEEYRAQQAAVMDTIAMAYGQRLLDQDAIKASSALQAASVMGICIDKSRLISGQSTSNSLIIHASASDTACTRWGDGHVLDAEE